MIGILPPPVLRQYIARAKRCTPRIPAGTAAALEDAYLYLRKGSYNASARVTAMPRQLVSLIRLAEARARLRFSPAVTETDVRVVLQLMVNALKMALTDDRGLIDITLLSSRRNAPQQQEQVLAAVRERLQARGPGSPASLVDLLHELNARRAGGTAAQLELADVADAVRSLEQDGLARRMGDTAALIE